MADRMSLERLAHAMTEQLECWNSRQTDYILVQLQDVDRLAHAQGFREGIEAAAKEVEINCQQIRTGTWGQPNTLMTAVQVAKRIRALKPEDQQ